LQPTGQVDAQTAVAINAATGTEDGKGAKEQLKVSGTVFDRQQKPVAQTLVIVVDVDLRGAGIVDTVESLQQVTQSLGFEVLGRAKTDPKGFYEVAFPAERFQRSTLQRADIIAYAVEGETIVGRSKLIVWKDSQPEITNLDITLAESKERSEYDQLMTALQPLLESSRLQLHELNKAQADFLAADTDQDAKHIAVLIEADKLRAELDNKLFDTNLFYALGRQEIPLTGAAIVTKGKDELKNALTRSIEQNVISGQSPDVVEGFIETILQHSIS